MFNTLRRLLSWRDHPKIWLEGYSGQTIDQLIALRERYRTDSLIVALDQALQAKAARLGDGSLALAEQTVVAVHALENYVNHGGFIDFLSYSGESVPTIVDCLQRIGCPRTAEITQNAINALGLRLLTPAAVEAALQEPDAARDERLEQLDEQYFSNAEPITDRLFEFVTRNQSHFAL